MVTCSCCHRELGASEPYSRNGIKMRVINASIGEQKITKYPIVCDLCARGEFVSLER